MSQAPTHVQLLKLLKDRAEARRARHREKAGDGLEDREYQRHVGRIRECGALIEEIDKLLKGDIDSLEDLQDEETQKREQARANRARRSSQRIN